MLVILVFLSDSVSRKSACSIRHGPLLCGASPKDKSHYTPRGKNVQSTLADATSVYASGLLVALLLLLLLLGGLSELLLLLLLKLTLLDLDGVPSS